MTPSRRQHGFTIVEVLVVLAILALLVALLFPAVQGAREAARRTQCRSNLRQIAGAVLLFERSHGHLPPAAVGRTSVYAAGQHIQWIPRILPFLEQRNLFDQIDFTAATYAATTGPANMGAAQTPLPVLRCPSDPAEPPAGSHGVTNFVGNAGTISEMLSASEKRAAGAGVIFFDSRVTMADVRDGASGTMLASECLVGAPQFTDYTGSPAYAQCNAGAAPPPAAGDQTYPATPGEVSRFVRGGSWFLASVNPTWSFSTRLLPNDAVTAAMECMRYSHAGHYAARSRHGGVVHVTMLDGSVGLREESIDILVWQALGSRRGNDQGN